MTVDELLEYATALLDRPPVVAAGIVVVGAIVVRVVGSLVSRRMTRGASPHGALVARTVIWYLGGFAVFVAAARALGVDLTALVATAGVATVAVGFAAQTSLSNVISGLFLLIDRPFHVGDTIELEGRQGIVQEITLLSTLMRTFDNVMVRWPNEVVVKSTILNYTRLPARRVDIPVGIAYGSDLQLAQKVISDAVLELPDVLLEPAPYVIVRSFLDSSVGMEVRLWVGQGAFLQARTSAVVAVHAALARAGIEIAFPQVTVWPGVPPRHPVSGTGELLAPEGTESETDVEPGTL